MENFAIIVKNIVNYSCKSLNRRSLWWSWLHVCTEDKSCKMSFTKNMSQNCKTSKKRQVLRKEIKYIWVFRKKRIEDPKEYLITEDPKENPFTEDPKPHH